MLDPVRKSSDNQQPQQRLLARFRGVAAILAKARPGIDAPDGSRKHRDRHSQDLRRQDDTMKSGQNDRSSHT